MTLTKIKELNFRVADDCYLLAEVKTTREGETTAMSLSILSSPKNEKALCHKIRLPLISTDFIMPEIIKRRSILSKPKEGNK